MNYESPFFYTLIMVGVIFSITGLVMYFFPPKKINYLYGYRTNSSMKTQENWDFAQKYASKLMIQIGFILSGLSIIGLFYSYEEKTDFFVALILIIMGVLILLIRTENAINKNKKTKAPDQE
jgi:uncharacterized membrane protein